MQWIMGNYPQKSVKDNLQLQNIIVFLLDIWIFEYFLYYGEPVFRLW